jgi:hypothetical protein
MIANALTPGHETGCSVLIDGLSRIVVLSPKVRTLPEWWENPVVKTVLGRRGVSPDWCREARGTTYI